MSKLDKLSGHPILTFYYHALPWVFGFLCVTSVPLIDGYFLGNYVGADALAAVNLSIPLITAIFALEIMISTGGAVQCAKCLGQGNIKKASQVFSKTIFVIFISVAIISTLGLLFIHKLSFILGANESLAPKLIEYLKIILLYNLFIPCAFSLNYFVSLDNNPLLASTAMALSSLCNILCSWLFVTQFQWGITGVALGSGASALLGFSILCTHFLRKKGELFWNLTKDDWPHFLQSAKNGLSEGINELSTSLIILVFNWIIFAKMGLDGLVALTIINFILTVQMTIAFAFGDTLLLLSSTNRGANNDQRVTTFLNIALSTVFGIGVIFFILGYLYSQEITQIFVENPSSNSLDLAQQVLLIILPVFLVDGFNIIITAYFTSLEMAFNSSLIALCRTLIFPLILIYLLPRFYGNLGIFMAIPAAELMTLVLSLSLLLRHKKKVSPLEDSLQLRAYQK
ncbi:MATE family efflux transporter [bacterium]|nr:MATE family efflux transporter [bacterium]